MKAKPVPRVLEKLSSLHIQDAVFYRDEIDAFSALDTSPMDIRNALRLRQLHPYDLSYIGEHRGLNSLPNVDGHIVEDEALDCAIRDNSPPFFDCVILYKLPIEAVQHALHLLQEYVGVMNRMLFRVRQYWGCFRHRWLLVEHVFHTHIPLAPLGILKCVLHLVGEVLVGPRRAAATIVLFS